MESGVSGGSEPKTPQQNPALHRLDSVGGFLVQNPPKPHFPFENPVSGGWPGLTPQDGCFLLAAASQRVTSSVPSLGPPSRGMATLSPISVSDAGVESVSLSSSGHAGIEVDAELSPQGADIASLESVSLSAVSSSHSQAELECDGVLSEMEWELECDGVSSETECDSSPDTDSGRPLAHHHVAQGVRQRAIDPADWPDTLPASGVCSADDGLRACNDVGLPHVSSLALQLEQLPAGARVHRRPTASTSAALSKIPVAAVYGTIRASSFTHKVNVHLSRRNVRELPNQLYFDPEWQDAAKGLGEARRGMNTVSVVFAEWLMGFPQGWTASQPIPCRSSASHSARGRHKTLSLFSGIAGLDLALQPWCHTIAYVERDHVARDILQARMRDGSIPSAAIYTDVREVVKVGSDVDGIVAGFPCVDTCIAGARSGLDGNQTSLVTHVFRLCDVTGCHFVFLENVIGIRSMPQVWRPVLLELLGRGFICRWVSLAASQVGAPHRRRRWFLYGRRGRYIDKDLAMTSAGDILQLPESPLNWNMGRPPPSEWLVAVPYNVVRAQLHALGNAVVPGQGRWAALLLSRDMVEA